MSKRDPFEPPGGYAGEAEQNPQKYEIRVGEKVFPMSRWREGILYFLFGVWSGNPHFWENPEIHFGEMRLILSAKDPRRAEATEVFRLEGTASDADGSSYFGNYSLDVGHTRLEVMDALARFAKDPYLGRLCIHFPDGTSLVFFQKERRGEYGCCIHKSSVVMPPRATHWVLVTRDKGDFVATLTGKASVAHRAKTRWEAIGGLVDRNRDRFPIKVESSYAL